ncbi:unnamed protein product [Caenorhabditis angaria]|uniref:7TM GPCR serpentine receptor class x (Srx) domain-containing protein n=1 Tax=Caenorhabditis angaria TaxID=860376 RepID=A0A9P1IWP9_9PELO|nr:unnamed protein product [Caenorhabditis angaria]
MSLLLNLLVAAPVFRFAFDRSKSSIYVLSAFNIFIDILHNSLTVSYLAPSMITNSYLYADFRDTSISIIIGTIFRILMEHRKHHPNPNCNKSFFSYLL